MKETLTTIDNFKSKHIGNLEVSFLVTKENTSIRIVHLATGDIVNKSFTKESINTGSINVIQVWFDEIEKKLE